MLKVKRSILKGAQAFLVEDEQEGNLSLGFLGRNPEKIDRTSSSILEKQFPATRWNYLEQVHGKTVVEIPTKKGRDETFLKGDAWLLDRQAEGLEGQGFCIRTADCLPIILSSERFLALIHAGWRGYRSGIIERVLEHMGGAEAVIGPAASGRYYEVHEELLDEFDPDTLSYLPSGQAGKVMLNLPEMAQKLLKKILGDEARVEVIDTCTIENPAFHSYRREGERRGSNFCFAAFQAEPF